MPDQYEQLRYIIEAFKRVQTDPDLHCHRTLADKMLRFNDHSASDRLKMIKYQQLQENVSNIKRYLSQLNPNPKHFHYVLSGEDEKKKLAIDQLIRILEQQSRTLPMEFLERYERNMNFLLHNFSSQIRNPFDEPHLKLSNITCQPIANHTLRRTFRSIEEYQRSDIKVPLKYPVQQCRDEDNLEEIPHALKGEIAGLDDKFRVSLDSVAAIKSIRLMCRLEDDDLPCVPPIYIGIPEKYPFSPPNCTLMEHDYSGTQFLTFVRIILSYYISNLPKYYTLTNLLNSWERSVRRALNYPNDFQGDSFCMAYTMCIQRQLTD